MKAVPRMSSIAAKSLDWRNHRREPNARGGRWRGWAPATDQNLYRKLSCQIRMKPAWTSTRPKLERSGALTPPWLRLPNFGVFVRLRISKRISPLCPLEKFAAFVSTRSTFLRNCQRASPLVRGAVPYWPTPGLAYAPALNQRALGWSSDAARSASLPDVFGSPVRLGRWRPPNRPRFASEVEPLMIALSGGPLTISMTADAFQPPSNMLFAVPLFAGLGSWTIGAITRRCGESKLLIEYSAARS